MLVAKGVNFSYRHGKDVVSNFSGEFCSGEMVCITGPSGCGKSTLLYLLGLMLPVTRGKVSVDGTEVSGLSDRELARFRAQKYGFVFQDAILDPTRTVLDNVLEVALYAGVLRASVAQRARELLLDLGVLLAADAKPSQVSGGQAQRIALVRALLLRPRIILADEPTGNLDHESAEVVMRILRECAAQGALVVIVTHDKFIVSMCDREVQS